MIVELDLRGNLYTEALERARAVLSFVDFERYLDYHEDSDQSLIVLLENEREEIYEWFRVNCPWWLNSLDRAIIDYLSQ